MCCAAKKHDYKLKFTKRTALDWTQFGPNLDCENAKWLRIEDDRSIGKAATQRDAWPPGWSHGPNQTTKGSPMHANNAKTMQKQCNNMSTMHNNATYSDQTTNFHTSWCLQSIRSLVMGSPHLAMYSLILYTNALKSSMIINAYDSKHVTKSQRSKQLLTAHLLRPWIKTKHPNNITRLTNPKTELGTSCCHMIPQQYIHSICTGFGPKCGR